MLLSLLTLVPAICAAPLHSGDGSVVPTMVETRPEKEYARPKLIAENVAATPGSTVWIGVTFEMDDGWHIYWDGQNDSGLPVTGTWELPEHVQMTALEWPTPKRAVNSKIQAIDYIHEKKVTAIAKVTIGDGVKPGQSIKIGAKLKWLVCHEQCVAGKGEVSLEIPIVAIGTETKESADASLFKEAIKTIPKPAKYGQTIVTSKWDGNTLILTVKDARGLVFYPDAKCAPMSDAIGEGESKTGELRLGFDAKSGVVGAVSGIVEVRRGESKPGEYYTVSIPGKERKE